MFGRFIICLILVLVQIKAEKPYRDDEGDFLRIRAYEAANGNWPDASDFPEYYDPHIKSRPSTGIAFSGGGSRAYVAALGYLRGLTELDVMKNIRYIDGISGGSWAATVYTWSQLGVPDSTLLGAHIPPASLTRKLLKEMDPKCAIGFASKNFSVIQLESMANGDAEGVANSWAYAVQDVYLSPAKIPQNTRFSWSPDTVKDIRSRNPALATAEFLLPVNKDRPFWLIGTTLVGPVSAGPYKPENHNMSSIEITPLYMGQFKTNEIDYKKHRLFDLLIGDRDTVTYRVGGAIEPIGMDLNSAFKGPEVGIRKGEKEGILKSPPPTLPLDLKTCAAMSSFAAGAVLEGIGQTHFFSDLTGMKIPYYSPTLPHPVTDPFFMGDGGSFENINLISLLQRRVKKIVLFFNSNTPLKPSDQWNVDVDPPADDQISDVVSAYFGILPPMSYNALRAYEYEKNQVFSASDYPRVIKALQASQQQGNGIIATFDLVTIENKFRGIPAGIEAQITFVYQSRLLQWEKELSPTLHSLIFTDTNTTNLAETA